MPGAAMSSSEDLVVALDYGQFYLHTSEEDPELAVDLLGEAQGAAGIAQQGGLVVIESPHQNNFEMPLRVEVWTAQPDDNLDDWEDAFEVHLVVGHDGLMYESPTLDMTPLPVPLGSYYAIITGRGFVGHGWPGSTTPGDSWRIRVWPSDGPSNPARLRRFTDPDDTDDAPRGATRSSSRRDTDGLGYDASLADQRDSRAAEADLRIGADLNLAPSARRLSHQVGTAIVDVIIPRDIGRVWPLIANLDITLSSAPNDAVVGNEFMMSTYNDEDDGFVGTDGAIVCRWTELVDPNARGNDVDVDRRRSAFPSNYGGKVRSDAGRTSAARQGRPARPTNHIDSQSDGPDRARRRSTGPGAHSAHRSPSRVDRRYDRDLGIKDRPMGLPVRAQEDAPSDQPNRLNTP